MPATSLLVYQTDGASGYQYYDGSNWNNFVTSSSLTGYVTTNTTQTVTGKKTFNAIDLEAADTFQLRGGDGRFTININENPFFEISSGDGYMFWMNSSGDRALFDNNALTSNRFYNLPDNSGTLALLSDIPSLTGYVTTNTTQTVTGAKKFNNVPVIKKTNTSLYPNQSGGGFYIGGTGGYDRFEFYSFDGTDGDGFGSTQIYSNPKEGNYIYHISLDNQDASYLNVNYFDLFLINRFAGQQTALYVNGQKKKIIIEGTQNKFAELGTNLITGIKNFEFPDKSGTLALTSDISGTTNYIPKFIGTTSLGNSRIFDNGTNVGIGTITPNTPIDISHNNASYGSGINITNTNTSGTAISSISFTQNSSTGYKNGSINLFNDGRMDFLSNEGFFNFRAKSSTSSNAVAMYIDNISSTSRVTIGPSNTASHPLRVTQQVSNVSIYADYDIVAFSDQSVKENIRPIKNVIERIENSRGILYDRVDSGSKDNIGFIAQELEQTFPELVTTNEDGTKAVKYQNAVAVLFEGIKEQQKQIDELKDMITKLINDK